MPKHVCWVLVLRDTSLAHACCDYVIGVYESEEKAKKRLEKELEGEHPHPTLTFAIENKLFWK